MPDSLRKYLFLMLASLILAGSFSYLYTTRWNPELRFWLKLTEEKITWLEKARADTGSPAIICFGGSSTAFAIESKYALEERGLILANFGLHAGMGAEAISAFALSVAQPGDTLLMMIEPGLLASESVKTALGRQFALAQGFDTASVLHGKSIAVTEIGGIVNDLRPGAGNALSMLGKAMLGKPLYRYRVEDIQPGGFITTAERRPFDGSPPRQVVISAAARSLMISLKHQCQSKGITLKYALPWGYVADKWTAQAKMQHRDFLEEMSEFALILDDGLYGVHGNRSDFADTDRHLTHEGAIKRTARLIDAIKSQKRRADEQQ